MSRKRWLLMLYAVAMTASTAFRVTHPIGAPLHGKHVIEGGVRIAYYDSDPNSSRQVLLLIHGSPGSSDVVRGLADLMKDEYRVLAPDLPGFGASQHDIPDYSFRAHAGYVLQLLQRLRIARVHAAGFSMGGGVVQSLPVPHFGALDGEGLNVEYARNFYDSDQRPLRKTLEQYRGAMLLLHGEHDHNVPLSAAQKHHRLAPQSQIVVFSSNHFMIFQRPELLAAPLKAFLIKHSCGDGGSGR